MDGFDLFRLVLGHSMSSHCCKRNQAKDTDVVHVGALNIQISGRFELSLAHVARMPPDIDVVHAGAVTLQSSSLFELLLAHVARMPPVGAVLLQLSGMKRVIIKLADGAHSYEESCQREVDWLAAGFFVLCAAAPSSHL